MGNGPWFELPPGEQFEVAAEKFALYSRRRYRGKCRKWARRLAHAALTQHPELREEGSLERYFVAKLGRQQGCRGVELTAFVERAYTTGLAVIAIEAGYAAHKEWQVRHAPGEDISTAIKSCE